MGQVYTIESRRANQAWVELDQDIVSCLADPIRQGMFYLHDPQIPLLEETTDIISAAQWNQMRNGCLHFATNFGFSPYAGTTAILSPDGTVGWVLIQLSDLVVDNPQLSGKLNVTLLPYVLKLMDGGHYFRFDGSFEEVMEGIRNAGYQFVKPREDELPTRFVLRLQEMAQEQRKTRVTDELVERINREYHHGLVNVTKEKVLSDLRHVQI